MLGPIDYVVLGFTGNKFDGSIMRELAEATNSHVIRILDMVLVVKDKHGEITETEYTDLSRDVKEAMGHVKIGTQNPLLTTDDIIKVAEELQPDTAAGILVIEHMWARNLKRAIADANGFLIDYGRVQPDKVDAAVKELAQVTI
jgi:uncharacterized membrane protein